MRTAGTCVAAGLAMPIFMNRRHLVLLLLCNFAGNVVGVCPHCNGHFASCTYDEADGTCPTIRVVAENAAAFVAGHGSISLSDIIPCRYLKMFTRSSLDTLLSIAKRPEPGTTFEITADTSGTAILHAINIGMVSLQSAIMRLAELMELADGEANIARLRGRLECLKVAKTDKAALATSSVADVGMFSYLWGKQGVRVCDEARDASSPWRHSYFWRCGP